MRNITEDNIQFLKELPEDKPEVQYIIFQKERGEREQHYEHLQGYIELKTRRAMKTVKEILEEETVHLEPRFGTQKDAIDYCMKSKTKVEGPWEAGKPKEDHSTRGTHQKNIKIIERLQKGERIEDIIEDDPQGYYSLRNNKALMDIAKRFEKPYERKDYPKVEIYLGQTGSYKTYYVQKKYPKAAFISCDRAKKDFPMQGYNGEKEIILDEFDSQLDIQVLNSLLNRGVCRLNIKGGSTYCKAEKIIITSSTPLPKWYEKHHSRADLIRRIKDYAEIYRIEKTMIQEQLHIKPVLLYRPPEKEDFQKEPEIDEVDADLEPEGVEFEINFSI